jgi:predicted phage replisome organizer
MFDDEKIKLIRTMPESDALLLTWVQLLVQAGKANASGNIVLSETIPYTEEMLAAIFDRPINIIRLALQTFQQFGMIDIDNGLISIANWEKHQSVDRMDKIREDTRKRVAQHREKQKKLGNGKCNVTVTQSNETEEELEEEKEKDINNKEANPFNFYEQNGFGTLSPTLTDEINYWIDGQFFNEPEAIIIRALKEAVLKNSRRWKYVSTLLIDWSNSGLKKLSDIEAYVAEFDQNKNKPGYSPKRRTNALSMLDRLEKKHNQGE